MLLRVPGVLIVNPFASRVSEELIERVAAELGGPEVLRTERAGHATELARAVGTDAEAIYVFSGDGGFNEVLNGSDGSVPLGFVPGGGTSVLPRALGFPRDPVAAARALVRAEPRRIALGRVNGRRFGFSRRDRAGRGADPARRRARTRLVGAPRRRPPVPRRRAADGRRAARPLRPRARGRGARSGRVPPRGERRPVHVRRCAAAAARAPRALRRGARRRGAAGVPAASRSAARSSTWRRGSRPLPLLALHDADRLVVRCDVPLPLQVDGEDLGDVSEAVLEAERDAVTVLAP